MFELVDKRILKKREEELARTAKFANYISNLFDNVDKFYNPIGKETLYKKDFDLLGKKEVPCIYYNMDDDVVLLLDYSFFPWNRTFSDTNVDFFALKKLLAEKGIETIRQSDHPEYEVTSSLWSNDLLFFKMHKHTKSKSLSSNN